MNNKYINNIKIARLRKFDSFIAKKVLEIRNQDDVRKNSINNKIIDQKNHFDWFKKILKVKTEYLYIIFHYPASYHNAWI